MSTNLSSLVLSIIFLLLYFTQAFANASAGSPKNNANATGRNNTHPVEDSEFPTDIFTKEQRQQGALILHCIAAIYSFTAIATVCTEFFIPTIGRFCQELKVSDDVAAATFMSIATSSPELFTNIIGLFVTNSDIGVGHVIGNVYFNIFFVTFLGGVGASKNILVDWWPIARDCMIFMVVSIALTWIVWDGQVQLTEAVILLALYVAYFIIMFANRAIIRRLQKCNVSVEDPVAVAERRIDRRNEIILERKSRKVYQRTTNEIYEIVPNLDVSLNSHDEIETNQNFSLNEDKKPSRWNNIALLLLLPIKLATTMTIPDVRKERHRNLYPISFVICVCWIGASTYLGTWMISIIGATIGIPDIIMGMVFMAAGGSVVEAYSVYYKVRHGECSIGLSNSMGCNTMDVTMCLALPWLMKILLNQQPISLASQVLHVNCCLLILSVILLYAIMYVSSFTLNWKTGIGSGVVYGIVLTVAIYVEVYQVDIS